MMFSFRTFLYSYNIGKCRSIVYLSIRQTRFDQAMNYVQNDVLIVKDDMLLHVTIVSAGN